MSSQKVSSHYRDLPQPEVDKSLSYFSFKYESLCIMLVLPLNKLKLTYIFKYFGDYHTVGSDGGVGKVGLNGKRLMPKASM